MNEKILLELGLSKVQSEIFTCLLQNGPKKASDIAKITKRPRGVAYKGLEELIDLGLAAKKENKLGVALFAAEHPANLEKVVEQREKEFNKTKKEFISYLPDFISAYNLASNKPGVRFYEGEDGVKKVLEDTLTGNPDKKLFTFSDVASYATHLSEWNTGYYAPKRKKLGVYEQVIIPDNAQALNYMKNYQSNEVTDILFIDHKKYPFATEINIYSNKVSFVTFAPDFMIGVIVENKEIYTTFLSIFNFIWEFGKNNLISSQPGWHKKRIKQAPSA